MAAFKPITHLLRDVLGPQNSPSGWESALDWDFSLLSWAGAWNEWANPQLKEGETKSDEPQAERTEKQ